MKKHNMAIDQAKQTASASLPRRQRQRQTPINNQVNQARLLSLWSLG